MVAAPDWISDIVSGLPPLVPIGDAARAVHRHPKTLRRAAARGDLVILAGEGGMSLVPRKSLATWIASWRRAGARATDAR